MTGKRSAKTRVFRTPGNRPFCFTYQKGFVKILEAIIASIILLTSLTFFFRAEVRETGWNDVLTKIRAEDLVYSLERAGAIQQAVLDNDASEIEAAINRLEALPPALDWSMRINGVPPPILFVGCACSAAEEATLEDRLDPLTFDYHGRLIEVRIQAGTLQELAERDDTHVIFLPDYTPLGPFRSTLNSFLGRGGTIFMLADLSRGETEDGYMDEVFGLEWGTSSSAPGTFYDADDADTNRIKKYYDVIGAGIPSFDFGSASIAIDDRTIIADGTTSFVKTNSEIVNGHGRTVWFDEHARAAHIDDLFRAAMLWASGESFSLVQKIVSARHTDARVIVTQVDSGESEADTYEAVMTLWSVLE